MSKKIEKPVEQASYIRLAKVPGGYAVETAIVTGDTFTLEHTEPTDLASVFHSWQKMIAAEYLRLIK